MARRVIYCETYPAGSNQPGCWSCCLGCLPVLLLLALAVGADAHALGGLLLVGLLSVAGVWVAEAPSVVAAYEIGPEGLVQRLVWGSKAVPWHEVLEVQVGRRRPWIRTTDGELDLRSVVGGKRLARRVRAVLAEEPVPDEDYSPLAPAEEIVVRAQGILGKDHHALWRLTATMNGIEVRSRRLRWWVPWHEADFARKLRDEELFAPVRDGWLIGFQGGQLRLFTTPDAAARLAKAIVDARQHRTGLRDAQA
ncbi:MAG: hypothetical protein HYU66_21065 [Armatimonadetes bacterium]|nr:hypothetical protein [Armatimonadota bacterium]